MLYVVNLNAYVINLYINRLLTGHIQGRYEEAQFARRHVRSARGY